LILTCSPTPSLFAGAGRLAFPFSKILIEAFPRAVGAGREAAPASTWLRARPAGGLRVVGATRALTRWLSFPEIRR
jgi:hypothetical protein